MSDDARGEAVQEARAAISILVGFGFWFCMWFWLWPTYGNHWFTPCPQPNAVTKWALSVLFGLRHIMRSVKDEANEARWKSLRHWMRRQNGTP